MPESGANVPGYRSWIDDQDFAPAYAYLHRMLQFLQWQKRAGGRAQDSRRRWVLKSPAHLGYLDALRAQFPDLHVVHMHRDPRETIPSGASLNATLHAHALRPTSTATASALSGWSGWAGPMTVRWPPATAGPTTHRRCTDIEFADAVADPIGQVARVYDAIGVTLTADAESAMRRWLAERPRETARPAYCAPPTSG